jgi:hypothetical protein
MNKVSREIKLEKTVFWKIKNGLEFNSETETFVDYLKKEKEGFDKVLSLRKLIPVVGFLLTIAISCLYSSVILVEFTAAFFLEGQLLGPTDLQSEFFSLLIITSIFSSVLGQILVIFTLSFKYFFTRQYWSTFHDQTLSLVERLSELNLLDEYISYGRNEKGKPGFTLQKLSVDFQVQWIFPFIFNAFPPLLIEIMWIAILLPFSIATLFSLLVALFDSNLIITLGMTLVLAIIGTGVYSSTVTIIKSWMKYSWIRNLMISRQQGILHELILTGDNDMSILRNQNNLTRLEQMHPFPLPSVFRITATIPLIGSLLGYVVGFTLLV